MARQKVFIKDDGNDGWTGLLMCICLVTTLGNTVPVGYFIGVINEPAAVMKVWVRMTLYEDYQVHLTDSQLNFLWTSIVSIFMVGGILGSLFAAWFSKNFGRKGCLVLSSVILLISSFLFLWCRPAKSVEMLMVGRCFGGIAAAFTFTSQPMYLLEMAPIRLKGSVGVFTCIGVTAGILLAQIVTMPQVMGENDHWPYALSAYALLTLLCLPALISFPESPCWLFLVKEDPIRTEKALTRMHGKDSPAVQQEMDALEIALQNEEKPTAISEVFKSEELCLPLFLVCSFMGTQQLSGINAIFFYSLSILTEAGFTSHRAAWLNMGIGAFNLCVSLMNPLIVIKFRRRLLLLISLGICALSLLGMSFSLFFMIRTEGTYLQYISMTIIFIFILGFQLGLGPIPYFIGSELLEDGPRPVAMSLGSLCAWSSNFLVAMCFPQLQSYWGSFAFMPCFLVCVACFYLVWRYLPETRGREAKDVQPFMADGLRSKRK